MWLGGCVVGDFFWLRWDILGVPPPYFVREAFYHIFNPPGGSQKKVSKFRHRILHAVITGNAKVLVSSKKGAKAVVNVAVP